MAGLRELRRCVTEYGLKGRSGPVCPTWVQNGTPSSAFHCHGMTHSPIGYWPTDALVVLR